MVVHTIQATHNNRDQFTSNTSQRLRDHITVIQMQSATAFWSDENALVRKPHLTSTY